MPAESSLAINMATNESHPYELLHIKYLLLRKEYHQCISASVEVLNSSKEDTDNHRHPFSTFFATFYLALAYDELARSMHEQSAFKLATFSQAEQQYRRALGALPSVEQCRAVLASDRSTLEEVTSASVQSQLSDSLDSLPAPRAESPAVLSDMASNNEDTSDFESDDDFEDMDRNTFSNIVLPQRPLQRDYSSMSLLDIRPTLSRSTSQGLLRPIRPGSPPKAYHLPPKLPYIGKDHSSQSTTPTLLAPPQVVVSSPLASPARTPTHDRPPPDLTRLSEHLAAMQSQINTHITLLQRAKLATTVAQAQRASRMTSTVYAPRPRIPQSKSFWSFTPTDAKMAEKKAKIEEGRARGLARKRYRSEKYEALAERALAEL